MSLNLNSCLSIHSLTKFKKTALRHGLWFKRLTRIERAIIDLTTRIVENIKSKKLAKIVMAIIQKLQCSAETKIERFVRTFGLALAKRVSEIAYCWGNRFAFAWATDAKFAKFLAINNAHEGEL